MIDQTEMQRRAALWAQGKWEVPENIDTTGFDFNWRPHVYDRPYIHQFGTQWQKTGGPRFVIPEAEGVKYVDSQRVVALPHHERWIKHYDNAILDWSWHPDDTEPPYNYIFGNQYLSSHDCPTVEYRVPDAMESKYVEDTVATLTSDRQAWVQLYPIVEAQWDYTWAPHPHDPPYIYVWGNEYLDAESCPTVEYHVPGATERKFMGDRVAKLRSETESWVIHADIDPGFDFTWAPHPWDPPYIYTWGNQFLSAEEMPTVEYHTPGATERKFMTDRIATVVNDPSCWLIHADIDAEFDFTWTPHPWDPPYIYVWGNQFLSAEEMPTVEYRVPGATERKYMTGVVATLVNDRNCWNTLAAIDESKFDFTWTPHPWDPPYIYTWGNQFLSAEEMPTVEYRVPGATEVKFMDDVRATLVNDPQCWKTLAKIDEAGFDFTWTPHPWDPPLIYVWGNQHLSAEEMPTVEYHVPGATERKYMDNARARLVGDSDCWRTLIDVDETRFDFTWTPHPWDPPYIYVWGNQFLGSEDMPTVEYHVPGATERKYMTDTIAPLRGDPECWRVLAPVDRAKFDWNWCPHPWDPPYIYTWGNQWNEATVEPTVEYVVEGATERKYMTDTVAHALADMRYWTVPSTFAKSERNRRFDYSWRPNPHSPPQIYQWENDGPLYTVPGATEIVLMRYSANMLSDDSLTITSTVEPVTAIPRYIITTTLEALIAEHQDEVFWATNPDLTYDGFDFDWRPDATNFRHVNVFGNALTKDTGTYYVNGPLYKLGHRQLNYVEVQHNFSTQLSVFWVDMGTPDAAERYEALRQRYPHVIKIRYMSSWVDTINRAIKKSQTKLCWVLCSHYDYSEFDFDFYPSSWQIKQLHVFGTQHSHWGHTYLVNTEVFPEMTKYVKVIEHLQNINHVRSRRVRSATVQHDILWIDFGVGEQAPQSHRTVYATTFKGSYLNTLREWFKINPHLAGLDNYRLWIVPSIVDHATFDFTFTPDPFQHDQLHVFASRWGRAKQKFGDIMLLNVGEFVAVMDTLERLEDYPKKIHYVGHHTADRLPHPVIQHDHDSQADAVKQLADAPQWPYYQLRTTASSVASEYVPSVWSEEHSVVMVLSGGASDIIVPRDAQSVIKSEVYDYPRIDFLPKLNPTTLLDIVFISNGEPIAEQNWQHLCDTLKRRGAKNRVHRVENVNGRIASQHVAAECAATGWYFLVNGKVQVNDTFDWEWQPDRLQASKHYIFTVTNPVNGLEYGHQAIVANNRRLTLQTTTVTGLDFTMSSAHEVVDMNCGVALYNTDPWTTWRTAFRECVKLAVQPDSVSQRRLQAWLSVGDGECGEWSTRGASDAVAWVESVGNNMDELLKSYEWSWLRTLYDSHYS